jgi:hypothetical protein
MVGMAAVAGLAVAAGFTAGEADLAVVVCAVVVCAVVAAFMVEATEAEAFMVDAVSPE